MPTEFDIETLIEQENPFLRANSVAYTLPINEVATSCLEWERDGVPFIVQGVPLDTGSETPFSVSTKWLRTLFTSGGATPIGPGIMPVSVLPCPTEWSGWLGTSPKVPNRLLPHRLADEFPESIDTVSCIAGISGCETYFEECTQGTTDHYLLCACDQKTSIIWFMTSSDEAKNVSDYLAASNGSHAPRAFTLSELAEAPFKVYVYVQKRGDLVVLPPGSFRQHQFRGAGMGASMFWSRMTLQGLEFGVFYDFYRRQRMCIPAKFPVKSIACEAMCLRFERLRAAGKGISLSSIHEMRKLLQIVNEILGAESHLEDDQLASFEEQPPVDLACASCGGEIFQMAFICGGSCLVDGKIETLDGNKVTICPLCFVDGRTCSCGKMRPLQVREIGLLVRTRDVVHDFIRGTAEEFLFSEAELNPARTHSVFMAALVLYRRRSQIPESNKACTFRSGQRSPSHQVPSSSLLRCSGCHSAKCFSHILASPQIHSSTALLVHSMDGQSAWHKYHVDNKNGYSDPTLNISTWGAHNLHHRLVYFAMNFKPLQFVNKNVTGGFYDTTEWDPIKPSVSAGPQSGRGTKPSGSGALSAQNVNGPSLSKRKGRTPSSRTSPKSSLIPPQSFKMKKRAVSPGKRASGSSTQEEARVSKRPRRTRKVAVSSDKSEPPSADNETPYLAAKPDDILKTQTMQLTRERSSTKQRKSFDPDADTRINAGPSWEAPRRYRSTWSNPISPSRHSDAPSSNDIRKIIKENLRELIPQFLGEVVKASSNLNTVNLPAAPAPEQPNSTRFPESDDRVPSRKGGLSRTRLSGVFLAPSSQRDRNSEDANSPRPPPPSRMPPVEDRRSYRRLATSLLTPTSRPSNRRVLPTGRGGGAHRPNRSIISQQSSSQQGSFVFSLPRGDQDSTTAQTRSVEFEGSSPTLRVAASRQPQQFPEHPRGTLGNHPSRPSAEVANPFAFEREPPPPLPRAGSTRSLNDGRRRTDPPSPSENSISPENLLYFLSVMKQSAGDMEAEYGHRDR